MLLGLSKDQKSLEKNLKRRFYHGKPPQEKEGSKEAYDPPTKIQRITNKASLTPRSQHCSRKANTSRFKVWAPTDFASFGHPIPMVTPENTQSPPDSLTSLCDEGLDKLFFPSAYVHLNKGEDDSLSSPEDFEDISDHHGPWRESSSDFDFECGITGNCDYFDSFQRSFPPDRPKRRSRRRRRYPSSLSSDTMSSDNGISLEFPVFQSQECRNRAIACERTAVWRPSCPRGTPSTILLRTRASPGGLPRPGSVRNSYDSYPGSDEVDCKATSERRERGYTSSCSESDDLGPLSIPCGDDE